MTVKGGLQQYYQIRGSSLAGIGETTDLGVLSVRNFSPLNLCPSKFFSVPLSFQNCVPLHCIFSILVFLQGFLDSVRVLWNVGRYRGNSLASFETPRQQSGCIGKTAADLGVGLVNTSSPSKFCPSTLFLIPLPLHNFATVHCSFNIW